MNAATEEREREIVRRSPVASVSTSPLTLYSLDNFVLKSDNTSPTEPIVVPHVPEERVVKRMKHGFFFFLLIFK